MRRMRAIALLVALLTTPSAMLAAGLYAAPQCCCCNSKMCPMSHAPQKARAKALCGTPAKSAACSCGMGHSNPLPLMIFAADPGTLAKVARLQTPAPTRPDRLASFEVFMNRSFAPPEQPPRS